VLDEIGYVFNAFTIFKSIKFTGFILSRHASHPRDQSVAGQHGPFAPAGR